MAGYVYLIGSRKFHWYKIGRSKLPDLRVKQIGVLLPFKVELIATWFSNADKILERSLHEKYAINCIQGEWFFFDDHRVEQLLREIPFAECKLSKVVFSNLQRDAAPPGKIIHIRYREDLSDEERERRKQAGIAKHQAKKLLKKNLAGNE